MLFRSRRHVGRDAVQLLPDVQRVDTGAALAGLHPESEAFALTDVMPGHVEKDREATIAHHKGAAGLLHPALCAIAAMETGADPNRLWIARQPEAQIEDRLTEVEHRTAARFIAPLTPAELGATGAEDVPAAADALQPAKFATLNEAAHDLHVGPITMIHADHQVFTPLLGLLENPLRPLGGEGERPLNQHVHTGRQRGSNLLNHDEFARRFTPSEWRLALLYRQAQYEVDAIRAATRAGQPLGTPEFLAHLEAEFDIVLPRSPATTPRARVATA